MNYARIGRFIALATIAVLILGAALVLWPKSNGAETEFVIEDGQTLRATGRLLAEQDLILSEQLFVSYAIFTGHEKDFKAGRYLIPDSVSIFKLVSIFSKGEAESDDITVTVPEGTNIADISLILERAGLMKKEDFLTPDVLDIGEGNLFPDTYRFSRYILVQDKQVITNVITSEMNTNFTAKISNLIKGLDQEEGKKIVLIASILEKEVQTEEDMRLVAGIIEKRLELGIPLQLDATVAYGVCYPKFLAGNYCDVSQVNLVDNIPIDSEYNTYSRKGLPVGPISNPGLKAIRAALSPEPSDYLFYLSAKDGTTIFSKTAAEHERARQKYLK